MNERIDKNSLFVFRTTDSRFIQQRYLQTTPTTTQTSETLTQGDSSSFLSKVEAQIEQLTSAFAAFCRKDEVKLFSLQLFIAYTIE
jgi:hypothetical protein